MKFLLKKIGLFLLKKKWFRQEVVCFYTKEIENSELGSELNTFIRKHKRSIITILRKETNDSNIDNLLNAVKNIR